MSPTDRAGRAVRRPQLVFWLLIGAGVILGTAAWFARNTAQPIARGAILEWYQKPAAVRFIGQHERTYVVWISQLGEVRIRFYDHRDRSWSSAVTVDRLTDTEDPADGRDDHNAPSLTVLPDGRLLLFYAIHNVDNALFLRRSAAPEQIDRWEPRMAVSDQDRAAYNYPQPRQLPDGQLVLFYRRGAFFDSQERFKVSKDGGQTWSQGQTLIDFGRGAGVYAQTAVRGSELHVSWSVRPGQTAPRNIYYLWSPDGGQTWQRRDGQPAQLPAGAGAADTVIDSGTEPASVWDLALDDQGNPWIAFAAGQDSRHELRVSRWDGTSWQTSVVTDSRQLYGGTHFYAGGIVFSPGDPTQVAVSKQRRVLELERWTTGDGGRSWTRSAAITAGSRYDNFRPQFVENGQSGLTLVWANGPYRGLVPLWGGDRSAAEQQRRYWAGFEDVTLQTELTKRSIPSARPTQTAAGLLVAAGLLIVLRTWLVRVRPVG